MTLAAMAADSSADHHGQYTSQQDDADMHKTLPPTPGGSHHHYKHNHNNHMDLPIRQFDRLASPNADVDSYQQSLPASTYDNPRSQPSYYTSHDAPPQLPPLPMSPHWDYSFQKSKAALMMPSPTEQTYSPQDAFGTPSSTANSDPSASALLDDNYPYTITPPASEPEPRASSETTRSQNFSRPRKPSLKQPVIESPKPRQTFFPSPFAPPPEPLDDVTPLPPSRPRGQSSASSSIRSASTFSTAPMYPSTDTYDLGPSRLRHARTAAPLVRPPPLPNGRIDSMESSYTRDMAPWLSADESQSRSSYRSQWSSAQGTWTTARSSVVTRDSSVHSVYVNPDEPSIEDVMGMYEKGFHDDSSPEDFDGPLASRENAMNKRNTRILEALERPLPPLAPAAQSTNLSVPNQTPIVRESSEMFRPEQPTSPLRESTFPEDTKDDESDPRDSVKSLQDSSPPPPRQFSNMTSGASSTAPSSVTMDPEDPSARDRYGFRKANQYITREQYDTWDAGYSEYLDRRRKKWIAFQKENGLMTDEPIRFPPPSAKTKRFIRKGIPPDWRGAAWFFYAGGPFILGRHSGVYSDLLRKTARDVDVEAIERDLHRTFPDNYRFRPGNEANTEPDRWGGSDGSASPDASGEPAMISSLRRVLRAFAIYNPRIGYCQSLNFLAGLLLLFLETEEQAFWLLNVITRVYLPGTHEMNLEGSKVDLGVLMAAVRETMPAVWAKIGDDMDGDPNAPRPPTAASAKKSRTRRFRHTPTKSSDRLPPITLCMTAWFMSCFIGTLPMETTLRVWDIFFYEGSKTLFRIALTIFKVGEAEIKAIADPMEMFSVVQAMPRRLIDANGLIEACFKRRNGFGHMSQDTIESQRRDRRNKAQAERDKASSAGGGASTNGNVTENEEKPRRKGTLFGRRPKKEMTV
ncbi:GTPase-activating protein gyp3 [Plectosphaerella plurivora]|uniref:GTPase-activating protein gyp3 n=1 Tax=Plectosphaerella plurivora TaxID=936078 RepID=A0A9P9A9H6_9PEZI|nr:GTPase-activating protein gyp3 [Plectosphaerella plurivora]